MPSEGAHACSSTRPMLRPRAGAVQINSESARQASVGDQRHAARMACRKKAQSPHRSAGSTVSSVSMGIPLHSVHGRLLQIRIAASTTTASASMPQVILHAAALHARQQAAAGGKLFAALVEAAVDHIRIEETIQLRPAAEEPAPRRPRCRPTRGGQASRPRAPTTHKTQSRSRRKTRRRKAGRAAQPTAGGISLLERVGLFGAWRLVAVEPPAKPRPSKTTTDDVSISTIRPGSLKAVKSNVRRWPFKKRPEPRPRRRSNRRPAPSQRKRESPAASSSPAGSRAHARGRASSRRKRS